MFKEFGGFFLGGYINSRGFCGHYFKNC